MCNFLTAPSCDRANNDKGRQDLSPGDHERLNQIFIAFVAVVVDDLG